MSKSLADQLLGAGLVDKKKAKQVAKSKRKDKKIAHKNNDQSLTDAQLAAQKIQNEKRQKDLALNDARKQQANEKALHAQVRQLAEHYAQKLTKDQCEYNFKDDTRIKKLRVSNEQLDALARGRLCVIKVEEDTYCVVPKPIADKISERMPSAVLVANTQAQEQTQEQQTEEDEYYAQFEIPDDLMW